MNEQRLSVYNRSHAEYCCSVGYSNHDQFVQRVRIFLEDVIVPEYGISGYAAGSSDWLVPIAVAEIVAMHEYSDEIAEMLASATTIAPPLAKSLMRPLVVSWLNSPGHFGGLIDRVYNVSGLGVAFDPESKLACAVQIFLSI